MLAHRVGQRRARLHVGAGRQNRVREVLVLFLRAENVEALHQRQPGVDHHRELTGEHREVLGGDLLPGLARLDLLRRGLRLGLRGGDPRDPDLLAAQRRDRRVHRIGHTLAVHRLPGSCSPSVCKCRHVSVLSGSWGSELDVLSCRRV